MRTYARVGRSALVLLTPFLLAIGACRNDHPEHPAGAAHADSSTSAAAPRAAIHDTTTIGVPGPGAPPPAWTQQEMIGNVERFIGTIERKDSAAFMSMLSDRSRHQLSDFHATDEIWSVATAALGDIHHRQISVLGGSRDSVALLIRGERTVEGEESDDPIVMSLLHESGDWKVMYPGLLYPNNHLKR